MELEELAVIAQGLLDSIAYGVNREVAPGWMSVYNEVTSQSKHVVHHLESGYVFKHTFGGECWTASGQYLGELDIDGTVFPIRLPRFYFFGDVVAQEFVGGIHHTCDDQRDAGSGCEHTYALSQVTGYNDCHVGNWKVYNGEVVLFDFD